LSVHFARLQAAFDVDLFAFDEIGVDRFGGLAPDDDVVPLGVFALVAFAVVVALGGRNAARTPPGAPPDVYRSSASFPRLPIRIALFTLPMYFSSLVYDYLMRSSALLERGVKVLSGNS
jgi:hypothetical protein